MTDIAPNRTLLKARWLAARDQCQAASSAYVQAVASPFVPSVEVTALQDEWLRLQLRMANAHLEYLRAGGDES